MVHWCRQSVTNTACWWVMDNASGFGKAGAKPRGEWWWWPVQEIIWPASLLLVQLSMWQYRTLDLVYKHSFRNTEVGVYRQSPAPSVSLSCTLKTISHLREESEQCPHAWENKEGRKWPHLGIGAGAQENPVPWDSLAAENLEVGLGDDYHHLQSGPAGKWFVDILQVRGGLIWLNPSSWPEVWTLGLVKMLLLLATDGGKMVAHMVTSEYSSTRTVISP